MKPYESLKSSHKEVNKKSISSNLKVTLLVLLTSSIISRHFYDNIFSVYVPWHSDYFKGLGFMQSVLKSYQKLCKLARWIDKDQ